jgi:hypothetical protein
MASTQTQPKADQPRVESGQLKRLDSPPSLTTRTTGIKTLGNRSTARKSKRS